MSLKLLSPPNSNAKLAKADGTGYQIFGLSLAPHTTSGRNVCPYASEGCSSECLFYAGHGVFKNVQAARVRRTKMFFDDRNKFMDLLIADIRSAHNMAARKGDEAVFRLNVLSDIRWETFGIMDEFPHLTFYDYTKIFPRMMSYAYGGLPDNYYLTFSRSETNDTDVTQVLAAGGSVAVVFDNLPETWRGKQVIDGDQHDLRFLDPVGSVVGLKAKGRARKDTTGFVIRTEDQT